jgi:hypothetical protein
MSNDRLRQAFFEDLAQTEECAKEAAREVLTAQETPIWASDLAGVGVLRSTIRDSTLVEAAVSLVGEIAHIALHSALVAIDGGSSSAEVGRLLLVDTEGEPLGDGLHELFVDYLFETGRRG